MAWDDSSCSSSFGLQCGDAIFAKAIGILNNEGIFRLLLIEGMGEYDNPGKV